VSSRALHEQAVETYNQLKGYLETKTNAPKVLSDFLDKVRAK
jgi:hypothetical protein